LKRHPPDSGDYADPDPLGILWSMTPVDTESILPAPFAFEGLEEVVIELEAATSSGHAIKTRITRVSQLPTAPLDRLPLAEGRLRGTLYVPAHAKLCPVVLVLGGAGGGTDEWLARLIASNGFAALTLAYVNYAHLPSELSKIPLEYFGEAIAWLKSQKMIDGDSIAVLGVSKGGALALLLGSTYPEISAVVTLAPTGNVCARATPQPVTSSWSLGSAGLPRAGWRCSPDRQAELAPGQPISQRECYSPQQIDAKKLALATVAVEKIRGPILLASGSDDRMWRSATFSDMVMRRLEEHQHPYERMHLCYEGAGHIFFLPHLVTGGNRWAHPFAFGGNPQADAHASADYWPRMLDFLRRHLLG